VNYLIKLEELTLVLPPLACPVVVVVTTACLLLDINYEHLVIAIYVDGALCFNLLQILLPPVAPVAPDLEKFVVSPRTRAILPNGGKPLTR